MTEIDVKTIEEIRICFDWARMIIPQKYVKTLIYEIESASEYNNESFYCSEIVLEVDLEYIKTHKYYEGNGYDYYKEHNIESDSELTIYERIQGKDVWSIEIVWKDQSVIELEPPTNRKEYYCSEKNYIMAWDAPNECEIHTINKDIFRIEWNYTDNYMTEDEIKIFFKKRDVNNSACNQGNFELKLFEHLFLKNKNGNFIFKNFTLKTKDEFNWGYKELNGLDTIFINAKNTSYNLDIRYILIPNENLKDAVYETINEQDENNCKWVLIFNDNIDIEKFMSNYLDKSVIENKVYFSNYLEFNKFWLQYKKENNLL